MEDPDPDFFVHGPSNAEGQSDYGPGGYHPVTLGDILPFFPATGRPRYRIMAKLGHGSFATVWLARTSSGDRKYVALKIIVARQERPSRELRILQSLGEMPADQPGARHIVGLLDHFEFVGPNGTHSVLVMEVLIPVGQLLSDGFKMNWKLFCHQLLSGAAFLHEHGITHADLHPGNVALTLPIFEELQEEKIMAYEPEIRVCIHRQWLEQKEKASLPPYTVADMQDLLYLIRDKFPDYKPYNLCVKIIDFGTASQAGVDIIGPSDDTPLSFCAPEILVWKLSNQSIIRNWAYKCDIWALACVMLYLARVSTFTRTEWPICDRQTLLNEMIRWVDNVPQDWVPYLNDEAKKVSAGNMHTGVYEKVKSDIDANWEDSNADLRDLIALTRRMLRFEPDERPQFSELLRDGWFDNFRDKTSGCDRRCHPKGEDSFALSNFEILNLKCA